MFRSGQLKVKGFSLKKSLVNKAHPYLWISQGCGDMEKAANSSPTYPSFSFPIEKHPETSNKTTCICISICHGKLSRQYV